MALKAPMTSATGNKPLIYRKGFSLIEIILVLGLIAIASTVVIANFASFADRGDELNTEESIAAAIRKARLIAASNRTPTALYYDKKQASLIVYSTRGEQVGFALNDNFGSNGNGEINFYLIASAVGLSPAPDPRQSQLKTPELRFAPDRSSLPFVVEIDYGVGAPERHVYDPFSSLKKEVSQ